MPVPRASLVWAGVVQSPIFRTLRNKDPGASVQTLSLLVSRDLDTVKPVWNDHLYNKI